MGARRRGRELALQMLYQFDVTGGPIGEVLGSVALLRNAGEEASRFAETLVRGTRSRIEEIDALLAEHMEHWRLARLSTVDRNILRLAVYECLETDTPKKVVINEALEVAKRFSSPDAVKFVNGVLDAVRSHLETASESH